MDTGLSISEELENHFILYLPTGINLSDTGTLEYEFNKVKSVNYHASLLVGNEIDAEYFLDFVESQGVQMESYLDVVCENLETKLEL